MGFCLVLTGCSPAEPTAVRLNEDGSVDFVSCYAVNEVVEAIATTTFRSGPNGQIDESTATPVPLDPPIARLDVGQTIEFEGLPAEWDRLDIHIEDSERHDGAYAYAERDNLRVGEWRWMGDTGILPFIAPCAIQDSDG